MKHAKTIQEQVEACRKGRHPRLVARVPSGWVVMGPSQLLPGYCLLLSDPIAPSLHDLDGAARAAFLRDMALVGDAVARVRKPRRVNYEILGNLDPTLHAHIVPRYADEPEEMRAKPVWLYPPDEWNSRASAFTAARHGALRDKLASALSRLAPDVAPAADRAPSSDALWQEAAAFAARAHLGQTRKDGVTPYASHCFRVAMTVRHVFGCDDPACIGAALLHDVIEDTQIDYDDVALRFGDDVARSVALLTKDMRLPEDKREVAYDDALRAGDQRSRLIKLADTYDNLCSADGASERAVAKLVSRCRRAIDLLNDDDRARPEFVRAVNAVEELVRNATAKARRARRVSAARGRASGRRPGRNA